MITTTTMVTASMATTSTDLSIDGATFAVLRTKHSEGGAIYRQVSCTQYKLIIHTPLDRERLPLQPYICPILGSKITVKLTVAFGQTTFSHLDINTKWKQNGVTVAGGNGQDSKLNQLSNPFSIYVDDDNQFIYIADCSNDRIVEWKFNAKNGRVIADGNGETKALKGPTDVIVDTKNNNLIICSKGNREILRWSREYYTNREIIISNISCYGLIMDNNGDLYVSDTQKHEVRRWKIGERDGTVVAGGNGPGGSLNQLFYPNSIFVDPDYSVYVSDGVNNRVMKWIKGAKEGIVVAGGHGFGEGLTQLYSPVGVIVDHLGNVYVADRMNDRIMRWPNGSKEGHIIVGGNGRGSESNQLNSPAGLSFDRQYNLYVTDMENHRIQKFDIDLN